MNPFRILLRRDIQFWAALATIIALIVALLQWLYPDPLKRSDNSPTATPSMVVQSGDPSSIPSSGIRVIEAQDFYFPWTKLLTLIFGNLPPETWKLLSIIFCVGGLILGGIIYFKLMLSDGSNIGIGLILTVFAFWVSIANWAWWGVLIGFGLYILIMFAVSNKHIYGAIIGIVSGGLAGLGIALTVNTFSGVFNESYLVVGNIIGSVVGILLGSILASFFDSSSFF